MLLPSHRFGKQKRGEKRIPWLLSKVTIQSIFRLYWSNKSLRILASVSFPRSACSNALNYAPGQAPGFLLKAKSPRFFRSTGTCVSSRLYSPAVD
jgi:hypothetical protein